VDPVRVIVVAASPLVRAGLEALVTAVPEFALSGAFPALPLIGPQQPDIDVAVVDLADADTFSGEEIATGPFNAVLLTDPSPGTGAAPLRSGRVCLLPRNADAEEIVAAIRAAVLGLVVLHPRFVSMLPECPDLSSVVAGFPSVEALTAREAEVLQLLADGLGNKAIAARLGMSEHTAKFHVGSILGKLGAASRTEAVALGLRHGLILL
jgi:DNA-binding NarL/FixJ family response regulator